MIATAIHAPIKPFATMHGLICKCGVRLGLHRFGDDRCPNPKWQCGSGRPQWMPAATCTFRMTP